MNNSDTRFLILEMKSAAMDGFYLRREDAEGVCEYLRAEYPWGEWIIATVDASTGARIHDAWFHVNRLRSHVGALSC
jgi:Holliday junction resolvase